VNWADRTLLATLLGVMPRAQRDPAAADAILRWHRDIVRRRWAARSVRGKTGRPVTRRNIQALVLQLARENPDGATAESTAELAGLGVKIAASTVWGTLKTNGIDPAPRRTGPSWSRGRLPRSTCIRHAEPWAASPRLLIGSGAPCDGHPT
jgi:hypothetical protein